MSPTVPNTQVLSFASASQTLGLHCSRFALKVSRSQHSDNALLTLSSLSLGAFAGTYPATRACALIASRPYVALPRASSSEAAHCIYEGLKVPALSTRSRLLVTLQLVSGALNDRNRLEVDGFGL